MNPVINSFRVYARWSKTYPGEFWFNQGAVTNTVFTWSVANATRYELYDNGVLRYSGTATSWSPDGYNNWGGYHTSWTLKAFNGASVSTSTLMPIYVDQEYSACQSGS